MIAENDITIQRISPGADSSFYVGGRLEDTQPGLAFLMQFTNAGNLLWQKNIQTGLSTSIIEDVIEDGDFLVGIISNGVDGSNIFKFDKNTFELVWMKWIAERSFVAKRVFLNNGNYVVVGEFSSLFDQNAPITGDYLIIDRTTGDRLANSSYEFGVAPTFFGTSGNCIDAVQIDSDIYTSGNYLPKNESMSSIGLTQYTNNGSINWSKIYLRNNDPSNRISVKNIATDGNSLLVIGSRLRTGDFNFIFKTDLDGNVIWAKELELPDFTLSELEAVYASDDAYWVTITGRVSSINLNTFGFIKLDKEGNFLSAQFIPSLSSGSFSFVSNNATSGAEGYYQNGSLTSMLSFTSFTVPAFVRFTEEQENCFPLWDGTVILNELEGIIAEDFSPNVIDKDLAVNNAVRPLLTDGNILLGNSCDCPVNEICDDFQDNDLDQLVDCDDPDCNCENDCGEEFVLAFSDANTNEGIYSTDLSSDGKLVTYGFKDGQRTLSKFDREGNIIWFKTLNFGSTRSVSTTNTNEMNLSADGFIYLSAGGSKIAKYDTTNHQMVWTRVFGPTSPTDTVPFVTLFDIAVDPTTDQLFGYFQYTDLNAVAVASFDKSTGETVWERPVPFSNLAFGTTIPLQSDLVANNGRVAVINYLLDLTLGLDEFNNIFIFDGDNGDLSSTFTAREIPFLNQNTQYRFRFGELLENTILIAFEAKESEETFAIPGLMEISNFGNIRWIKRYEFPEFNEVTFEHDFQATVDGYLILGEVSNNEYINNRSLLFKVDKEGNGQWANLLGGEDNYLLHFAHTGQKVVQDSNNIFLVSTVTQINNFNTSTAFARLNNTGEINTNSCFFQSSTEWSESRGRAQQFSSAFNIAIGFPIGNTAVNDASSIDGSPSSRNFLCEPRECCPIDLTVNIDTAFCDGDSLAVSLYIKNLADSTFNGIVPVSFYDKNPTIDSSATLLTTQQVNTLFIPPTDSLQVDFRIPYPADQVFVVVNDSSLNLIPFILSDSTFTGIYEECVYENNLDSIGFERPMLMLDLGPDTTVCENSAIVLDAGPGFASYRWLDATIEQTYTAFETGVFTVEAFDICNTLYTDTIVIQLDTAIGIAIDPPIAFICPQDSALLQIPILPDYNYQWFDANDQVICEGCQEVYVSPDQSTTYTVVATNNSGCYSADSIFVNILDCEQVVELMVCEGESASFAGMNFTAGEQDTMLINDTLFLIRTMEFPEAIETRDTFICPGSSIFFEGQELFPGSSTSFQYTSVNGCDSTLVLNVLEDTPIVTQEEFGLCSGDSVLVFGQFISQTGSYSQTFTAIDGCDSVHTIIVAPLATPEIIVPDGFINCLSGTGALEVEINSDVPIFTVFWSTIERSRRIENLQAGDHTVTVVALNGCTAIATGRVIDSFADINADIISSNISCFGANDGQISILNPDGGTPPYRFSLNGAPFSSQNTFEGLSEGSYQVEVRDANDCGTFFDFFIAEPSPLSISLPAEIIVPLGDTVVLNPAIQSNRTLNYSWEPTTNLSCSDCPTPSLSPSENQQYTLFVSDSVNCQASATVFIRLNREGRIFIPNVFSPNGDGINDIFGIFMDNSVDQINVIQIYNRWGSDVFQRSNVDKAAATDLWDGTINGTELPSGTYIFSLEVTYLDGFTEVLSGEISLIR